MESVAERLDVDFTASTPIVYRSIGGVVEPSDLAAVMDCLDDAAKPFGSFFPGSELAQFEQSIALREGASHAVAVNSCGTALDACLASLNLRDGDEVITTGLTFAATACSITRAGGRPVLADIDPWTFNLDPHAVGALIGPRTRAILPVHFAGLACDVDAFEQLARSNGLAVIYDAAHALGARSRSRPIGNFGYATCYSFQYHKHMTCLGEGGAITSPASQFAEWARQFRSFGFSYPSPATYDGGELRRIGMNFQMTRPQLAFGCSQLIHVDQWLADRRKIAHRLREGLAGIRGLTVQRDIDDDHACLMFVVRIRADGLSRDQFRCELSGRHGIETKVHYSPLWSHAPYADLWRDDLRATAAVADEIVSLPIHPLMTPDETDRLVAACRQVMSQSSR